MKIVDRKTFLSKPPGTLFSKYQPCHFGELMVKGETWGNDFLMQDIANAVACDNDREFDSLLEDAERSGSSFQMDFDCQGRDGLFEGDQLFAIWEGRDIEGLQSLLSKAALSTSL
jgi:hypothetical protein